MQLNGNAVKQSYAKAVNWFRGKADQGFAEAPCNLGVLRANSTGMWKDYAAAANTGLGVPQD